MSETQPTPAQPDPHPAQPEPPPAQRTRLRDLVFGLRSLAVVAAAGVIVGGLAGYAIHAATDDDHQDRMGRFGPGFGPGGGFGPGRGPGGGFPGGPGQGPYGGPGTQQLPPPAGTEQPSPSPTTAPSQSS